MKLHVKKILFFVPSREILNILYILIETLRIEKNFTCVSKNFYCYFLDLMKNLVFEIFFWKNKFFFLVKIRIFIVYNKTVIIIANMYGGTRR